MGKVKNKVIRVAIAGQGRSGYGIHADALRKKADKYRIVAAANAKNTSGYTLVSFESGRNRFYDNLFDVLHGRGKLLITPAQVRRQIAVLEECLRQNKLPRRVTIPSAIG